MSPCMLNTIGAFLAVVLAPLYCLLACRT